MRTGLRKATQTKCGPIGPTKRPSTVRFRELKPIARSNGMSASKFRALREPDDPTAPIIRATEPNLEGLLNLLVRGRPSLGVFTAEGGSFLGGHGMTEDAKVRTLTGLSMLYDSGSAQRRSPHTSCEIIFTYKITKSCRP